MRGFCQETTKKPLNYQYAKILPDKVSTVPIHLKDML